MCSLLFVLLWRIFVSPVAYNHLVGLLLAAVAEVYVLSLHLLVHLVLTAVLAEIVLHIDVRAVAALDAWVHAIATKHIYACNHCNKEC